MLLKLSHMFRGLPKWPNSNFLGIHARNSVKGFGRLRIRGILCDFSWRENWESDIPMECDVCDWRMSSVFSLKFCIFIKQCCEIPNEHNKRLYDQYEARVFGFRPLHQMWIFIECYKGSAILVHSHQLSTRRMPGLLPWLQVHPSLNSRHDVLFGKWCHIH